VSTKSYKDAPRIALQKGYRRSLWAPIWYRFGRFSLRSRVYHLQNGAWAQRRQSQHNLVQMSEYQYG